MKKYTKPSIEIVELESRQNMADVNPITATSVENTKDFILLPLTLIPETS